MLFLSRGDEIGAEGPKEVMAVAAVVVVEDGTAAAAATATTPAAAAPFVASIVDVVVCGTGMRGAIGAVGGLI